MDEIAQLKAAHEAVATAAAAVKARAAALRKQAEELENQLNSASQTTKPYRIPEAEKALIRQHAHDGKTVPQIAKLMGVKYQRVKQFIKRNGIECTPSPRYLSRSASGG